MKRTVTIFILMCVLGITGSATQIMAQSFDANRMNRDISIMENILAELFRTQYDAPNSDMLILEAGVFRARGIRGTYLTDYGIIFMIPAYDPMRPRMHSNGQGYSFYYNSDENPSDKTIDKETIETRITEFLMNYGSTIGQLKDNENVMVIYGTSSSARKTSFPILGNGRDATNIDVEENPVVSVSVSVKDLKAYRKGNLSADAFKSRVKTASTAEKESSDLKVMSTIFETGLRETSEKSFRMMGGASYMMLENFGAIFNFDARYMSGRDRAFTILRNGQSGVRFQGRNFDMRGQQKDNPQPDPAEIEAQEKEMQEEIKAAYADLKADVIEYLVDYGRTLTSVDTNQHILTSVNIGGPGMDDVPERVDFQIKKSVLEDLDKGKISRDNAMKKVVVTEF